MKTIIIILVLLSIKIYNNWFPYEYHNWGLTDTITSAIINDTLTKQLVEQIAADTVKAGSMQARILLEQLFNERINEVFMFPPQIQLKTSGTGDHEVIKEVELISDDFIQNDMEPETKQYEGYRLNNYPNPYSEGTIIAAYIPGNFKQTELVISDVLGQEIKHVSLKPGPNFIEISADELNYGIYYYGLFIEHMRIDTKKMVHIK